MLVLLSPSKTLAEHPERTLKGVTVPRLLKETEKLLPLLRRLSARDLERLMDISPKLAALNHARYQRFTLPLGPANSAPAILMFQGAVYEGLDAASLSDAEIDHAHGTLRILSGLYGILRAKDRMHPYRLEMGIKLKNPSGPDLYRFWKQKVTDLLNADIAAGGHGLVVNLASNEYVQAVDRARLKVPVVDIRFLEKKGKEYKMIAIHAKRARGVMARDILRRGLKDREGLKGFSEEGYRYLPDLSGSGALTFGRSSR